MDLNSLIIKSEIKIFQHCNHERIICFTLPENCPICQIRLDSKSFRVPPFVLATPFMKSPKLPAISLILQPSSGDYSKLACDDMHIGITNSLSEAFDFDHHGLKKNSKNWIDYPFIHIKLDQFRNKILMGNETKKWDDLLEYQFKQKEHYWSAKQYDETNLNCFDFIINFLYVFGYFDLNEENEEEMYLNELVFIENNHLMKKFLKQKLANELIEPVIRKSLKYIYLLMKLNSNEKAFLKEIVY